MISLSKRFFLSFFMLRSSSDKRVRKVFERILYVVVDDDEDILENLRIIIHGIDKLVGVVV